MPFSIHQQRSNGLIYQFMYRTLIVLLVLHMTMSYAQEPRNMSIPDILTCKGPVFLDKALRDNETALTGCCNVVRTDGPISPAALQKIVAVFLTAARGSQLTNAQYADSSAWFDAGATILQAASDRFWGEYALSARCLATALRLADPRGRAAMREKERLVAAAAHSNLGYALQRLREHAGGNWRWKVATNIPECPRASGESLRVKVLALASASLGGDGIVQGTLRFDQQPPGTRMQEIADAARATC